MTVSLRPGHLFCLAAFLVPLIVVFAPLGMTPLLILLALGCLIATPRRPPPWPPTLTKALIFIPLWAAITAFWAIAPATAWAGAVKLAALVAATAVLMAQARAMEVRFQRPLMTAFVISSAIAWGLLLALGQGIDLLTPLFALFESNVAPKTTLYFARAFTILTILTPLILLSAKMVGGWPLTAFMAVLALAAASITHSLGVKLSVVAMVVTGLAMWYRPRITTLLVASTLVGLVALAPLIPRSFPDPQVSWKTMRWIPFSTHHRMTIWQFTATRIAEKPLFGWGMEAARDIPGGEDVVVMERDDALIPEQMMPLHPHNGLLQIWLELGAVGAVATTTFLVAIALVPARFVERITRVGTMATLSAVVVVALVSFGVWQSWWLSSIAMTASFWSALLPRSPSDQDIRNG